MRPLRRRRHLLDRYILRGAAHLSLAKIQPVIAKLNKPVISVGVIVETLTGTGWDNVSAGFCDVAAVELDVESDVAFL
jgi:hypothetical protein